MSLRDNLLQVQARLAAAAARAGRDPDSITLVAVSKTQPVDVLIEAYRLGIRQLGENRVEEAAAKIPAFKQALNDSAVVFHMIGHLQGRKADEAVTLFDRVHSVDSVKLARRLDRFAAAQNKTLPVTLEVNVSGEASKYGFDQARRDELFEAAGVIATLPHLQLDGLMTMAPMVADAEETRPVFRGLRLLRDEIEACYPHIHLPQLSMGMTDDFEVAVEEGATLVRIGRAIFGERAAAR
jgi:pyridoxal phosphate enzyme (YggS family)